jgi:2,3-diketo-5-methylthio-1-phosphopentane phosphatase
VIEGRAAERPLAVFVDYDGTITDVDTFDILVRAYAGPGAWEELEAQLARGTITLREAMNRQASFVRGSIDEADDLLRRSATFDPSFAGFAHACRRRHVPLAIVSSGIRQVIRRALRRNGAGDVTLFAGDLIASPDGWTLAYPGDDPNGLGKASFVERAQRAGYRVVYAGDGRSDFEAARLADLRFAKRGKALAEHLEREGLAFTAFSSFSSVQRALELD